MSDSRKKLGKFGEDLACSFLERKGYQIVARNYRGYRTEIDIVARLCNTLVFVEVKTRTTRSYGLPEESISFRKQRNLAKTVESYIRRYNLYDTDYQVDSIAVEIDKYNKKARIRHLKNIILE